MLPAPRLDFALFWELKRSKVSMPMVAVLGPYSGGTSAVAGALHHLGVSMGSHFETPDKTNRLGNIEALPC